MTKQNLTKKIENTRTEEIPLESFEIIQENYQEGIRESDVYDYYINQDLY